MKSKRSPAEWPRIPARLRKQLDFVAEIDKVKRIYRQTYLMDRSRFENDAEHSWHLAVMAMILCEYANSKVNLLRVLKMVLIHDIVEIDAGDTFCYSRARAGGTLKKEARAAKRIFGLLPRGQAREMRRLWEEFEARKTRDAVFAAALDRLHPVLHNYRTRGAAWRKHGVIAEQVRARNSHIDDGSRRLWRFVKDLIDSAVRLGYLPPR